MEIDTPPQSTKCHYKSIGYTCGHRIDLPYIKHKLASCMVKEGASGNVECGNLCTYQEIYQYHGPCYQCSTGMVHAFWKLVDTEDEKQWEDLEKYIGGMSPKD
ncbi:uncharacterized protein PAC_16140 [Phialocephala subalpina]|uniref:Uncharacterized protein n=1 Tax=Phialocephala subalpina TaxID=576137 RepID=A0A1L7XMH6_9HELO|nr:uncharacterized protein PAC_16140 [Phialocephala subalpina]